MKKQVNVVLSMAQGSALCGPELCSLELYKGSDPEQTVSEAIPYLSITIDVT